MLRPPHQADKMDSNLVAHLSPIHYLWYGCFCFFSQDCIQPSISLRYPNISIVYFVGQLRRELAHLVFEDLRRRSGLVGRWAQRIALDYFSHMGLDGLMDISLEAGKGVQGPIGGHFFLDVDQWRKRNKTKWGYNKTPRILTRK